MASEGSTSYQGVLAQQNAKVHAGHVYSNVTNNYPSQPAISTDLPLRHSSVFGRANLAPRDDSVHKDFVKAARQGQGRTRLEYLLSRGANVDVRDENGLSALYHAAFQGHHKNVRVLLRNGADVNSDHCLLGTPIAVAALRGHFKVVSALILHRADVLRPLAGVGSALHCACFGGNTDIFVSIVRDAPQHDYLGSFRIINLKAFSIISSKDLKPSGLLRLLMEELDSQGPSIRCSPLFLAAERCHVDILNLCWTEFHHDYCLLGLWGFADREEKAAHNERPQRRIKASLASVESRSERSFASKGSTTSSAWSTLGFPLTACEHPRSTLLAWAAASLNLPLIVHLLGAGASANTADEFGQTALHHAADPFLEATFKDVKECVGLLLADQASLATKPSIRIAQTPPPVRSIKSPLELVVGREHAALDPRTTFNWGLDIHRACISAFLDPLSTDIKRSEFAQEALLHALSHNMCPADSLKLLIKHAAGSDHEIGPRTGFSGMDEALYRALRNSADESIIPILLDHGANPNAETYALPLIAAINSEASEAVVIALLQYGADPNLRQKSGLPMTPYECAKQCHRQDMIVLFERRDTISRPPCLTPSRSTESVAKLSSCKSPRGSRSPNLPTSLDEMDELNDLDELNESNDDLLYKPEDRLKDEPNGFIDSSRPWFLSFPAFPLPRFGKNIRQE